MDNFVDNLVYTLGKGRGKHGEMCSFMWKRQLLLNIYPQFYPDFPVSVKLFTFLYVFINSIDLRATPPFILTLSVMTQTRQEKRFSRRVFPFLFPCSPMVAALHNRHIQLQIIDICLLSQKGTHIIRIQNSFRNKPMAASPLLHPLSHGSIGKQLL